MFQSLVAVSMLLMLGLFGSAHADPQPTHEDADACQPDIHRLCQEFYPDEKLVATCLVDKRSQLSVACAEVLARPREEDQPQTEPAKPEPGPK